jgi:hypothetical protein
MSKPKGGRGQKAPCQTKLMRAPVPLEEQINQLIERYQNYLQANPEVDADNPPTFIDFSRGQLVDLIYALE